ncbi:MAG: hypothetical protein DWQ02_12030 [Bacteroidetes bacterium]|nr:MAG: hypothetical protein DWQ02_12030 [Bacteroidota bacterium]
MHPGILLFLLSGFLYFFNPSITEAQSIEGRYYLRAADLHISFTPPTGTDDYGVYTVEYANGTVNSNYYAEGGGFITLAQFNNGMDESFNITYFDGSQLSLTSQLSGYRFDLVKAPSLAEDNTILATANGQHYTQSYLDKTRRFVEFLLGTSLSESEKVKFKEEAIKEFNTQPTMTLQQVTEVDQQMQQLYRLSDVSKIGLVRSALLQQIDLAYQSSGETDYLLELIQKHCRIIATDHVNMLALTEKEVDGYLQLAKFYSNLAGQEFSMDETLRNQLTSEFITTFQNGNLETRQSLCIMGTVSDYVINAYNQLSPQEQQNYIASMYQTPVYQPSAPASDIPDYSDPAYIDSLWPEGVDTKEEKQAYLRKKQAEMDSNNYMFNTISNMMTQSHVTSLNIIENMGNSGNYWETVDVKY